MTLSFARVVSRVSRRLLQCCTVLVYGFILAPVPFIFLISLDPREIATFPPATLSLHWYAAMVQEGRIVRAIYNSFLVAGSATLLSGIIGVMMSIGLVRYRFRGRGILSALAILPMVLPEIILGANLLIFWQTLGLSVLSYSYLYLIVGQTLLVVPYVIMNVSPRVYGLDRSLEEASMNLGANSLQTFREITLPLILPGILSGMLFALAILLDDFTATQFWVVPGTETIPIRIYTSLKLEFPTTTNALAGSMFLFMLLAFVLQIAVRRREEKRRSL